MHSPTNCYLVSLAAADCVVLIASVPNEILSYYVIGSQWIWGPAGCAIFVFLQNLGKCSIESAAACGAAAATPEAFGDASSSGRIRTLLLSECRWFFFNSSVA